MGLPTWLSGEEFPASAGDVGLILGSGRSPEEGNSNPLQCSCLGNPTDRGGWWATVHGVAELNMTEQIPTYTHTRMHAYTHTCAHVHTHIHVYAHTCTHP